MPKQQSYTSRDLARSALLRAVSLTTLSLALGMIATAASAQSASGEGQVEEVVVTGSRILRKDYVANSPIVTVGQDILRQSGSITPELALNQLPQFTPGASATTSFPPSGGRATLNLRGLGTNRVLVLMDGRRIQPGSTDGAIDINLIPSALIENVETITGGASSTYGSDAMAGVVNFKLKRSFEGFQVDAQYGQTQRGDAQSREVSLLWGGKFADGRGSAQLAMSYVNRSDAVRGDRDFFALSSLSPLTPNGSATLAANPPSQAAVDAIFAKYGVAAGTAIARGGPFGFNPDGTLFTAAPVTTPVLNYRGPLDGFILNYNNAIVANAGLVTTIQGPLTRYNIFARGDYQLTPHAKFYGQALYTTYQADATISGPGFGLAGQVITVPYNNPFLPADFKALLASRPNPTADFPFTYVFTQYGGLPVRSTNDIYQFLLGLSGDLPSTDWTWDVYGSVGRTTTNSSRVGGGNVTLSASNALLRAPDGGVSICQGGFNPFGIHPISQSCLDYLKRPQNTKTVLEQKVVEANVQGSLFDLPAGKVRFAAGGTYRSDSYDFIPDYLTSIGDFLAGGISQASSGTQSVYEGFGELLVPVIKDVPLIKEFNLNGGYRYSKYNTAGGVNTYKLDFDWSVISSVRLRGGYSRAIKAPSLINLYQPLARATVSVGQPTAGGVPILGGDPCDVRSLYRLGPNGAQVRALCAAQGLSPAALDSYTLSTGSINGTTSGNKDLLPEKADTFSIGAVWRSQLDMPLLARLSASVDYYDIKVTGAVGTFPLGEAVARCFNTNGTSNPSYAANNLYCTLLGRRNINGNLEEAQVATLNLGSYKTSGIDFQVDWAAGLGALGLSDNYGSVGVNVVGTYTRKFLLQSLPGGPTLDYLGATSGAISGGTVPKWKVNTTLNYDVGRVGLSLRWRYIGSLRDASTVTNPASTVHGVPAYSYFDLNGRWRITDKLSLRAGVNNLFDKDLPLIGTTVGTTDVATYDPLGRSFYMALSARF